MNNPPVILVVDDEPLLRKLLKRILDGAGFVVATAIDGKTALRLLEEVKPDLMLLDVIMPGLDGNQVILEVRKKYDMPIIMLTAMTSEEDVYTALNNGADDFIRKPFNANELITRIRTMLRRTNTDFILNQSK